MPDISFQSLSDFYIGELRKGTAPPLENMIRAFPAYADEIRDQFPALQLLETRVPGPPVNLDLYAAGDRIGGCEIGPELGRGAMGVVFRAVQADLGRTVALKVIPLPDLASSAIGERFAAESRAMARLDHPHIVPVHAFGHEGMSAYIVMKYIDGCSLDQLVGESADYRTRVRMLELRADPRRLARIGADVASGLQHAHERGLIHRDIKPANLLLDRNGKVWITDFGLAKVHDLAQSLSRTGDAVGTPRYMAPEQLRGVCDPRSDVYALGISLYELTSGRRAWEGVQSSRTPQGGSTVELPDLRNIAPEIPQGLSEIIMKACSFRPEDRYQSARELQVVLERIATGAPVGDRRKGKRLSNELYHRICRRNLGLAVIASAVTFAGAILWWCLPGEPNPSAGRMAQKKTGPAPAPAVSTSLVEKMADANEDDMVEIVGDFFKSSIAGNGEELRMSESTHREIASRVDRVLSQLDNGGSITKESLNGFLNEYRNSLLPLGTRIMSLSRTVSRSGLPFTEQQAAIQALRDLSVVVVNQVMPEDDARLLLSKLVDGRDFISMEAAELEALVIPDDQLKTWLQLVRTEVEKLKLPPGKGETAIANQVERMLSKELIQLPK